MNQSSQDRLCALLPCWGKLVHRMVIAQAAAKDTSDDERQDHGGASSAPVLCLCEAVDADPGDVARRVHQAAIRAG
jgi:hypothetical protein